MSGNLIGSAVGAGIGFVVGGPTGAMYGWTLGGIAGGVLMPEQMEGPRLGDLKVQTSEYGRPIPITYGTLAISGNVIWASDLIEVEGESGGKGGPEVTNYSYFANFAVAICEGEVSLGRIWAGPDKRLIWDGATLEGAESGAQIRFYSGTQDQEPDPLIESYLGAGYVPGYRGTAYVVFENFPVANDGNRIPFLLIEVGAQVQRIGYVWPRNSWLHDGNVILFSPIGVGQLLIQQSAEPHTFVANYHLPLGARSNYNFFDPDRNTFVTYTGPNLKFWVTDLVTGLTQDYLVDKPAGLMASLVSPRSDFVGGLCYQNGRYIFATYQSLSLACVVYSVAPDSFETVAANAFNLPPTGTPGRYLLPSATPADDYVIAYGYGNANVYKLPLSSGAAVDLGTTPTAYGSFETPWAATDPNTGYVWIARNPPTSRQEVRFAVYDPVTETKLVEDTIAFAQNFRPSGFLSVPATGTSPNRMYLFGTTADSEDAFFVWNADDYSAVGLVIGVDHSIGRIGDMLYDPARDVIMALRDSYGASDVGEGEGQDIQTVALTGWRLGDTDTNIVAAPLSNVVADLSARAGLSPAQYDVAQLEDDLVYGYAVTSQMSVKAALDPLLGAYFFDGVESGGLMKFVKRGGAIVATIEDNDLGAHESGGEPAERLETVRAMDDEMPAVVTVRYMLEPTKYDIATRIARRLVGNSGNEITVDLPLVLTDTKAQEVAEVALHMPWVERLSYRFSLPRKYADLEPTDPVTVLGHNMRILRIKQTGGRYQVEAIHEDANVYTPHVVVTETVPPPPENDVVVTVSPTVLELM
jgi:hypothetical protein